MGMGSAGPPAWQDDKAIDEERQKRQAAEIEAKLKALESENQALKKRIEELEAELKKQKK